jgi:hypothetical protein
MQKPNDSDDKMFGPCVSVWNKKLKDEMNERKKKARVSFQFI